MFFPREHEKAEAGVKRAQNSLEALVGPFRLRKAVRGALKRGMVMPFLVSVQRGKAAAKLERGKKMREASLRKNRESGGRGRACVLVPPVICVARCASSARRSRCS